MLITPGNHCFNSPKGLVVLEGVNGAGKSTLQKKLVSYLRDKGIAALSTFEPGDSPIGKHLRQILLEHKEEALSPYAEVFLFSADRREHVEKVLRPALRQKRFILCDRYFYSTMAFQGYGRRLDLEKVDQICRIAVDNLFPDLVVLLDLDPDQGLLRNRRCAELQGESQDAFEEEELAFHARLRDGFLEMARHRPEPFLVIDAAKGVEQVFLEAKAAVDGLLDAIAGNQ